MVKEGRARGVSVGNTDGDGEVVGMVVVVVVVVVIMKKS